MSETLIKVEGVSKKFCQNLKTSLWYGVKDITKELMGLEKNKSTELRKKEFWAIRDISFEVKRGECLGLIGRNGAGKSTLLKMVNGLIKPDFGRIEIRGRVGALIELGAGFNPILTGRENIYNSASLLGFRSDEISKKLDSIIAFSELEKFLDTPVQYYSSGMKVRLGFSVAAHLEPEVLLIDEVLAVGDMGFVLKCFNKMDSLLKNTAMILVSHNIPQIARMSTNILFLNKGTTAYNSNDVSGGITRYYEAFKSEVGNFHGSDKVTLDEIALISGGKTSVSNESFTIQYGEDMAKTS
jgi:lipopolysaccharide transport system ATP-binding protein